MKQSKKRPLKLKLKFIQQMEAASSKWSQDRKEKKFIKRMQCTECPHSWAMTTKGQKTSTALPLVVICPKCKSRDVRFKDG